MDIIFDIDLVAQRRRRALGNFDPKAGFLIDIAAEEMAFRLSAVERHFENGVELFGATGAVARALLETGKVQRIERVDVTALQAPDIEAANFEDVPLEPEAHDLVVAPLGLHLVNDLPGSLLRIRRALKPDGLFLAAVPGADTLAELSEILLETEMQLSGGASPRVMPFADVRSRGALMQRAGLALPVADVENYTVRYDSLFALMRDLRSFGMTNMLTSRSRKPLSRAFFLRAAQLYAERYADPDGRIRATFSIVYLSGWAPHESQPKPLRPGSATMRLADALKAAKPG